MEVRRRILARDNEVTIRWVPAHSKVAGNEKADEFSKAAARQAAPCSDDEAPDELRQEASLSHRSRSATEARSHASAEWIACNVRSERRHSPYPRREASAASAFAEPRRSWPKGTTSSSPVT